MKVKAAQHQRLIHLNGSTTIAGYETIHKAVAIAGISVSAFVGDAALKAAKDLLKQEGHNLDN
jgi:uncharacterized protein (DUF1778 family)